MLLIFKIKDNWNPLDKSCKEAEETERQFSIPAGLY